MRKNIKNTESIFPMPVLMIATYNEDWSVDVINAALCMVYDYCIYYQFYYFYTINNINYNFWITLYESIE